MIAFLSTTPPPAPRGPKIQNGLFCMVGYTGEDGKHYGRRITNPWHDCPPPLFLGQVSFLSCDMGSCLSRLAWFCCFTKRRKPEKLCFITAVVGRLVAALLYLACLFSLSLLFSSPIMCFIVLTSPRHVLHAYHACSCNVICVLVAFPFSFSFSFVFLFCIYCILLWRLARRHGWVVLRTIFKRRSVGRSVGMYRTGRRDTGGGGLWDIYIV